MVYLEFNFNIYSYIKVELWPMIYKKKNVMQHLIASAFLIFFSCLLSLLVKSTVCIFLWWVGGNAALFPDSEQSRHSCLCCGCLHYSGTCVCCREHSYRPCHFFLFLDFSFFLFRGINKQGYAEGLCFPKCKGNLSYAKCNILLPCITLRKSKMTFAYKDVNLKSDYWKLPLSNLAAV